MRVLLQHWTESSMMPAPRERSVWRNKKAQKQDRFLRGRQIAYLIYEYFQVTGSHDSVENYTDLFTIALRNDDIQEFDSNWDGNLVYDEIPTWWHLGKIVQTKNTRVWETQDRIGIVCPGDSSEESRTWLSQIENDGKISIEQDLRNRNFWARNGNSEKRRGQESRDKTAWTILGDCKQWEANGQCSKADNCSFRHDINKRGKVTPSKSVSEIFHAAGLAKSIENPKSGRRSPSGRISQWPCKDYFKGTCTNSFCEKVAPSRMFFYKTKSGCRFGEKCSYAHRQVDEQPSKTSKKNDDKSAASMFKKYELHDRAEKPVVDPKSRTCWVQFIECTTIGLCLEDMEPSMPSWILRKSSDMQKPIQRVKLTKSFCKSH